MQIGVIGLGRMGGNISRRLIQNKHEVVVYDHDAKAIADVTRDGAKGADGLEKLVQQLAAPRAVWVMLPAGKITDDTIAQLGKISPPAISCSMAATHFGATTSAAPKCCANATSIMSMSARAAASGALNAAIA